MKDKFEAKKEKKLKNSSITCKLTLSCVAGLGGSNFFRNNHLF